MGWDQEVLSDGRMPDRADIDEISPKNPVALIRVCGHIALLNSAAIRTLELEGRQGPEIVRDPHGRLTGIVKEGALEEVRTKIPRTTGICASDLLSAEAEAAKHGLTTLHAILSKSGYVEELEALAALHKSGSLSLKYRIYIPPEAIGFAEEKGYRLALSSGEVRVNGVKIYADGSLGARTAALREPYSDEPGNCGMLRYTDEELTEVVKRADSARYQVIIHAIGDRAVEQAIDALSQVTGSRNPQRHRIEHASLLPKDLMSRMGKHCIRAGVQPLFIASDTWALERLGEERINSLYPFNSMLAGGIVASGGSDSPVEKTSPVLGMWAAMARGGRSDHEALSLEEAVRLYTSNASSNGFDEGPMEVTEGSAADLTLLDSDISGMHSSMVRKVTVAVTVVKGTPVYSCVGAE